jgi:hypothetical protein
LGMLVSPWMGGILNEGMTTRAARWSWVRPVAELELKDWRRLETCLERLLELFSSSEELRLSIDPVCFVGLFAKFILIPVTSAVR